MFDGWALNSQYQLATTGDDRRRWIFLLDKLPYSARDLHYHPDYMRIYEMTYGDRAALFVYESETGTIFQPFISRPIPESDRIDLTSVYGYGGPLSIGTPDLAAFHNALQQWFSKHSFVSEYCLMSPFLTSQQRVLLSGNVSVEKRKDVVVADLSHDMHVLWANIAERQRKACAVARRKGVRIEASALSDDDFTDFHARYIETMDRVDAGDFWKFPDTYFVNCRDALGLENVTLLHAVYDSKRIATFFHIHLYDTVYYHFACADPAYRSVNPTSLLLLDSLIWAKSEGFRWFHMGGGRTTGQDTLFTFKYSFCGQTLPLYGYTRVIDEPAYADLVAATESREMNAGGVVKQTEFFPRYRG